MCEKRERSGGRPPRLTNEQLRILHDVLCEGAQAAGFADERWTRPRIVSIIQHRFGISYNLQYVRHVLHRIAQALLETNGLAPFFEAPVIKLYRGDAAEVLAHLPAQSVHCIVTSPPYYGQRDYGVPNQIGHEAHPQQYIERLVAVFREARRILRPEGSLWVNMGDTYWSGKGQSRGKDTKRKVQERFLRPQDRTGQRPLCTPKQLLLIPHRFAIAMQEDGWIVRNDNVWNKVAPMPDPVYDRCATAHEYMFHFVLQKQYYFNYDAVAVPSNGRCETKPPSSVWTIPTASSFKKHTAVFPEEVVKLPIQATCPPRGVFLDPFCGSGTALSVAIAQGEGRYAIGIDISLSALCEAQELLRK